MQALDLVHHCGCGVSGGVAILKGVGTQRNHTSDVDDEQRSAPFATVVGLGDSSVRLLEASGNREAQQAPVLNLLKLDSACTSVTTNQDSTVVVTSLRGQVWEVTLNKSEPYRWRLNGSATSSCMVDTDIVVGLEAGKLTRIRSLYNEPIWESASATSVNGLALCERSIVAAGQYGMSVYDLRTAVKSLSTISAVGFTSIASSLNNGMYIATGNYGGYVDLWDIRSLSSSKPLVSQQRHRGWTSSLAFNPSQNGSLEIFSAGNDGNLVCCDMNESCDEERVQIGPLASLAITEASQEVFIIAAQADGQVRYFTKPARGELSLAAPRTAYQ